MKTRILPLLIAAALASGTALASEPANAPQAATAEQKAAKAEIDRLVDRIKVLSKELGDDSDVRVIVRTGKHDGPGWKEGGMDHDMMIERMGPEGGKRKIRIERMGPGGHPEMHIEEGDHIKFAPEAFKRGPGLGIVMAPNPAAAGVRIAAVTPESPAQKAGLRTDDVLLSVDGKTISGSGPAAVENARVLLGKLKQGQVVKLRYARQGKSFNADVKADEITRVFAFNRSERMPGMAGGDGEHHKRMMMLPRGIEMDIERMGPMKECKKGDDDCGLPAIYQAFRWQGLNLSSVDAGLGRYFGTDKGVLVLSSGPELKGLQSGDVIQRVAGKPVESPRDVMRELRDEKAGSQLKFDVLRDRKTTAVTVTVPKSRPLPFIEPAPAPRAVPGVAPVPPVPPVQPTPPPPRASAAPRAPAALPGQWDEQVSEVRSIDADGNESIEVIVVAPAAPVAVTPSR
jgi:membrane-associated protease RseP (regulator of RpoE activity)